MPDKETIMLRFVGGGSDKGYQVILEPQNDGWVVNAANGRWGSTFVHQPKTQNGPVPYEKAKQIFDKVVKEKLTKGYKPVGDAPTGSLAVVAASIEERETGIYPQLLNPIEPEEAEKFISDPGFWAQEKFDGKRILLKVQAGNVVAINRKGLVCGIAEAIIRDAVKLDGCVIDGEAIGESFFAFDLLEHGDKDVRSLAYSARLKVLSEAVAGLRSLRGVVTAKSETEKSALFQKLKEENREGIVFKAHRAPYEPGRPKKGGNQRKLKFWATATCVCTIRNDKRSIGVSIKETPTQGLTPIGNVTIPPNQQVPKIGELVEIRYLYAIKGGSLYQPQFIRIRDDIDGADSLADLKFKSENMDSDEE